MDQTTDKIVAEALAKIEAMKKVPATEQPAQGPQPQAEDPNADAKAKAIVQVMTSPTAMVAAKVSENVVQQINNDEQTGKKVAVIAQKIIGSGLNTEEKKATAEEIRAESTVKDADFESNESEFAHHGITHKVKPWQSKAMCIINDVWFVVITIIFAFTLVPFSTFLARIKGYSSLLKWVASLVGILMLLAMLFGVTVLVLRVCGVEILAPIGG
jgi:hypothetical protein